MNVCPVFLVFVLVGVRTEKEDTLVLIHAVVRHGQRTPDPLTAFPKNENKNITYFPYGGSELNKQGIQQLFVVGKQLRKRYESFFGAEYHPEVVEATSSGYTRCRMSMQILLAAIFPPAPSQQFEDGLAWQPIPYQYTETKTDQIIAFVRCIGYLQSMELKPEFNLCPDRDFMYEYLTEHTGMKVDSLQALFFIRDGLKSEEDNGLAPPAWAKSIWREPLQTCSDDYWRHISGNRSVIAAVGGAFMKKIIDDTRVKIKENSVLEKRKLFLYTGHDFNIYLFLAMLGIRNIFPDYVSYFLFEVHKISGVYGFKIYFQNNIASGLHQLEIPGCGAFCPVEELYELMKIYFNSAPCPN